MKYLKKYGALILGAIFLFDFIHTLNSISGELYEVIGLEVSKTTYLAYLLAIAVSFLTYGYTIKSEKEDDADNIQKAVNDK